MTHPSSPSSSGRIRFKSSHRRITLKISHRRIEAPGAGVERSEERERYIAPPKRFRR
jgi:hypothetical protein